MRTKTRPRPDRRGPLPPSLPTSKPTGERQRQAEAVTAPDMDGAAVRPWWRVESRLDSLFAGKLIDRPAFEAATALAHDVALVGGTPASPTTRIGSVSGGWHDPVPARLDAAKRLRTVRARIGDHAYNLVVAVAAEDLSWRALGRKLNCRDVTARRAAVEALTRLAASDARQNGNSRFGTKRRSRKSDFAIGRHVGDTVPYLPNADRHARRRGSVRTGVSTVSRTLMTPRTDDRRSGFLAALFQCVSGRVSGGFVSPGCLGA